MKTTKKRISNFLLIQKEAHNDLSRFHGYDSMIPAGFEPSITTLKGSCPNLLDHGTVIEAGSTNSTLHIYY